MKRRPLVLFGGLLLFAAWLAFLLHSCTAGPAVPPGGRLGEIVHPPVLRVGLSRCLREPSARLAVRGPFEVRAGGELLARGEELPWTEVRAGEGIRLGEVSGGPGPLSVIPGRDGTLEVEYLRDFRGGPVVPPAVVRYRGRLLIRAAAADKLVLVNEVDLEDYLRGVVGQEMSLEEEVEALKAQAIAARTYALCQQRSGRLSRVRGEKFDLYDDERSQVYGGMQRETPRASGVVDATRGLVVVYEEKLVPTFYSSACGGATDAAWDVLGEEAGSGRLPPLGGRKCGFCERRAVHRWEAPVVVSKREISERCLPSGLRGRRIRSLEIARTLPGGRALELAVSLEGEPKAVRLPAADFRRGLVSVRLRSLLWDRIEDRGEVVAIVGRGWGHGAGMCQVGACEMARDGRTAAEILEYYFPGAAVRKIY